MPTERKLRIGLAGIGTVGGGVWANLARNADLLQRRCGATLEVVRVLARRADRARELGIPEAILTADPERLTADPAVDVVVELIGGTTDADRLIRASLAAGKHVVTANKALLAKHGRELFALASQYRRQLLFEASVAGGIPLIKALREGLVANRIESIYGIINGTCNYILSLMNDRGLGYAEALADAKAKGYAEADESLDVEGHDAAHKAAVITALAYGFWVPEGELPTEGIAGVRRPDIIYARQLGYELKLLAVIKADPDDSVEVRVQPTLVPKSHVLASVGGVFNAVMVRGDVVGDTLYYGRGAGAHPTASAVISDLAELACLGSEGIYRLPVGCGTCAHRLKPIEDIISRYYLRLAVVDQPGVLARVATILAAHRIGISSVIQPESHEGDTVPLVVMLHDAQERAVRAAIAEIAQQDVVRAQPVTYRVEDFET
jgi:homoserine dehydrogenase